MVFIGESAIKMPESDCNFCFRDSNGVKDSAEADSGASPRLECLNIGMRLCTKPKLLTGIGFGGDPIRARMTV
jgi:hypothetical protein